MSSRKATAQTGGLARPLSAFAWSTILAITLLILITRPSLGASSEPDNARTKVILVMGAAGEAEYGSNFLRQVDLWQRGCTQAEVRSVTVGLDTTASTNDFELLRQVLVDEPKEGSAQLWVVFIGHGTFDGKESWFNLRGPDVSASQLATWLQPFQRPLVVINTASASGPFINKLSATNRVVITATRSGNEQNFTHFGQYFAEALTDSQADVDQDGQVSLLEAFLIASKKTAEFYKAQGRLATEHSLLDDNGDGLGTPAEWFRGLRATKKAKDGASLDGLFAQLITLIPGAADRALTPAQLAQRDTLEKEILLHREKKTQMPEDDYYKELDSLLLQLARLYASTQGTNSWR